LNILFIEFKIVLARQKLSKRKENDLVEIPQGRSQLPPNPKRKKIESKARFSIRQKEQNSERSRLLDLAMDWKCIDAAKEFIFKNSLDNILVWIFILHFYVYII
jgi:hypothetical protein